MIDKEKKIAIVLFNLGGPASSKDIKTFLFNLFYDKAIINIPNPFRFFLAKIISIARSRKSRKIYSLIGNKSPLLEETELQRLAIAQELREKMGDNFEIFIIMRYFTPRAYQIVKQIESYKPDEVVLLPLYPQFSTATTSSSIQEFFRYFKSKILVKTICCYSFQEDFINAHTLLIKEKISNLKNYRILFSAHGLPESMIKSGDPYRWQVEQTVKLIVKKLSIDNLDYKTTYQSKIGPVKWLEPDTKDEVLLAAKSQKNLVIIPITFVSEHVETLVELDKDYKMIADYYRINYVRIPTLRENKLFIKGLVKLLLEVIKIKENKNLTFSANENKLCPCDYIKCLFRKNKENG